MARFFVNGSNDMSTLDLSTIANGDITTNTSSEVIIHATDGTTYALFGTFSGGSGSTLPTSGTITRLVAVASDGSRQAISTMQLPVQTFDHFLQTDNASGLLNAIFAGNDTFDLTKGSGNNGVLGEAGNDKFMLGGTLDAQDSINGGGGHNTVVLEGNYGAGLVLGSDTLVGISALVLNGAHDYNITTADGTVAANHTLTVDAKPMTAGGVLTFDGSAETDGKFDFMLGKAPGATVTGGAGNDVFHGAGSGATLNGGGGNDLFSFGANFNGTDVIDGGTGHNTISLNGDYSGGLTFGADSLQNIQGIVVQGGHSYDLTLSPANLGAGSTLTVDGLGLHAADSLTFDGSATLGNLILDGGPGADTLIGGGGHNTFDSGLGVDSMTGGGSKDRFVFSDVTDSTGRGHDTIINFDADHDTFVLNVAVSAVDPAVTSGSLSQSTFDTDLRHDLGATELHAHDAVLFTASSGTYAGDTFLVVDENGTAGYQTNQDLVIQLTNGQHLNTLDAGNFTVG